MFENLHLDFILQYLPQNSFFQNKFVEFFVLVLFWILVSRIFQIIVEKIIVKITVKTKTDLDDKILNAIDKPLFFILAMFGFLIGLEYINASKNFVLIIYTLIIIALGLAVLRVINLLVSELFSKTSLKKDKEDPLISLLTKMISVAGWIILGLFILTIWGVQIGPFLAGVGVAGLAVSFALQKSLEDIFGGIALTLDKNFKIGDPIELDDGTSGKVKDIGLRSTKILNWDGETVIVPNSKLAGMKFTNFKLPTPQVRGKIPFGVAYGSDVEKVKKIALKVAKSHEKVLEDPEPFIIFDKMNDSSIDFTLYFYVKTVDDRFSTTHELIQKLYLELGKNGIEIPYPTRTVYLKK